MNQDRTGLSQSLRDLARTVREISEITGTITPSKETGASIDSALQPSLPSVGMDPSCFETLRELIEQYEPSKTSPEEWEARKSFLKIQDVFPCATTSVEGASLKKKGASACAINPPDLFCTFYYVVDQKRIYSVLHDDYRDSYQRVVIIRDHEKKAGEEFSAKYFHASVGREEGFLLSALDAEKLYVLVGDLHQSSERIFYKE